MKKIYIKPFLVSLKYVLIGTKQNGVVWGYKAFKGSLRILNL